MQTWDDNPLLPMITTIIRKLPASAEFCLIVFVCSWWAIALGRVEIAKQTRRTSSPAQPVFAGIGVELGVKENKLVILQVLPDTPAAAAGLARGWMIQQIDGRNPDGRTPSDCGELILQRYGLWSAVLASACFRAFLHAYHGITALIIIFPLGLVFGFIYWKWRRLWPLFVAQVLFDLLAYFPGWHAA